jgi:hypothetical protein
MDVRRQRQSRFSALCLLLAPFALCAQLGAGTVTTITLTGHVDSIAPGSCTTCLLVPGDFQFSYEFDTITPYNVDNTSFGLFATNWDLTLNGVDYHPSSIMPGTAATQEVRFYQSGGVNSGGIGAAFTNVASPGDDLYINLPGPQLFTGTSLFYPDLLTGTYQLTAFGGLRYIADGQPQPSGAVGSPVTLVITQSSAPEPATFASILLAAGLLGLSRKLKRSGL